MVRITVLKHERGHMNKRLHYNNRFEGITASATYLDNLFYCKKQYEGNMKETHSLFHTTYE